MSETFLLSIMATGFVVAFAHAAIPTHWLPFVMAGRGQRWSKARTLLVVALCGSGHVLFTTGLGVVVVWLGIETSKWTGNVFPWIAGGALILFGLYYLVRQARGEGHGHTHFIPGSVHHHDAHDHSHSHSHGEHAHDPTEALKRIDTGHGVLLLEVFETGVPPRFRVRGEGRGTRLPRAEDLSVKTIRTDGTRHEFTFVARDGYLESVEDIPEPHAFTAAVTLSHGDHGHVHETRFEEHAHAVEPASAAATGKSDRAVIASLFTLLTFSPCEGFLPIYLSGIHYGWVGFVLLSAVLAFATIAGMVTFTWLTLTGIERLPLGALEQYESGILGALILFLGVGIILFGF